MKAETNAHAKIIPIKSRLYKFNKITKKSQRLSDNSFRDLGYIIRANDRSKYISEKAQKVATNFHKMLGKTSEKKIFVDQVFLSNITRVSTSGQNANIIWQLDDIFTRQYHDAVYFDGEIKRWGYIITYTEDGEQRMNNPSKFYKINSLLKPDTNCDVGANKLRPRSKKITTHSIYKELIEDSPYRAISSINEESASQESVSSLQTKFNETSPDAALPTLRGSSTGEFLTKSYNKQDSSREQTLGATILSLLPKLNPKILNSTNAQEKEGDLQLAVESLPSNDTLEPSMSTETEGNLEYQTQIEDNVDPNSKTKPDKPYDLDEEFRQALAEKSETSAIWQGCLRRVAENMGETYDPLSGKMREVTLEDIMSQFDRIKYKIDLKAKDIKLQAKGELWIPAFEMVYSAKFKEAAHCMGYSFELVRTLEEKQ